MKFYSFINIYSLIYLIKCVNSGKFYMKKKQMKPFHCGQKEDCEGQSLFGTCPSSHPFAFNKGRKCCTCEFETFVSGGPYRSLDYLESTECYCNSIACPGASICSDKTIGKFSYDPGCNPSDLFGAGYFCGPI